jgi:menaquinone-9 beta-reductase
MRPYDHDVIVVGGGPAGAATATFLRQRGHDVLLLDEARFPRDKVCGEGVSPEAWRLLAAMGADGAVRALRPQPLRGMTLTAPDGTAFSGHYRGAAGPGFAARRCALDACLLAAARAAGVEVREGAAVSGVLAAEGRVTGVVVDDRPGGGELRARLVVGADGRRSVVARQLGLLREHPRLRKFAVRGYWSRMAGLGDMGEMHVAAGAYCGVAPLGGGDANVTFVVGRGEMRDAGGDLEGFYRRTLERWPRLVERLSAATLVGPPRAIGPLALVAKRVSSAGAAVVGDAAGFYDPFTGEGVTLALRGAEILAGVADRVLHGRGTLAEYDRLRDAATRDKFRLNRRLQAVVAWPALANAVARRLARRPDLADRLVGIAGDFVPARTALGPRFLYDLVTS